MVWVVPLFILAIYCLLVTIWRIVDSLTAGVSRRIRRNHVRIVSSVMNSKQYTKQIAWDTVILRAIYVRTLNNAVLNSTMQVEYYMDRSNPKRHARITYNFRKFAPTTRGVHITGVSHSMSVNFEQDNSIIYTNVHSTADTLKFITEEDDAVFTELISRLRRIVKKRGNENDLQRIELLAHNFGNYANGAGIIDRLVWIKLNSKPKKSQ